MSDRLFIAARAPRPGFTKTRLGRVIGHESAALLYRAFLADIGWRFASASFDIGWYVTPPDAWREIRSCINVSIESSLVVPQPDGDWTARQRALFASMGRRAEDRAILIASDSPQLPTEFVADAFDLLREHDVVFGPVLDGGYYLIGMRTARAAWILDGVTMSDGDVLQCLVARARSLGFSVGMTAPTFDVDESDDLVALNAEAMVRPDLQTTRRALDQLGLLSVDPREPELLASQVTP